jgi:hypothetical protein
VSEKTIIFGDVKPYSLVEVSGRFGETYCLHFQGTRVRRASKQSHSKQSRDCLLLDHIPENSTVLLLFLVQEKERDTISLYTSANLTRIRRNGIRFPGDKDAVSDALHISL